MSFNMIRFSGHDTKISNIEVIGEFSVNGGGEYCPDLSQLKYYKPSEDYNIVHYDLKKYHHSAVYKESADIPLDNLLRWVSDHFDDIKSSESEATGRWLEPEIICFRGTISTLLRAPFDLYDGFIIRAAKFRGTIYLRCFKTEQKKMQESKSSEFAKQSAHWGFKFEQYMLADSPSADPNPESILNENEEFCCMFKSRVGTTSLLYAGEIDGICSDEPITETVAGKDVKLVELKTYNKKHLPLDRKMYNIKCVNLLKWWSQCYPAGIRKVVVGVKDYNGIIDQIQEYDIEDVVKIVEPFFSHTTARKFLNKFLEHIKSMVLEDHDKCIYEFSRTPGGTKVQLEKLCPNLEKDTVIPQWYIDKAKKYKM